MALTLTNADLLSRYTQIADFYLKADSGTTTTAVNTSLIDEVGLSNYYICFLSGSNKGTDKIVTSFDDTTGTLTFDALDNAVDNTSIFALTEIGFGNFIAEAEASIENHLRNNGYDLSLFLTSSQLKEVHILKTLELICRSRFNDGTDEDLYFKNMELFQGKFDSEMSRLIADYDTNEDGTISDDEEDQNIGQVVFAR